MADLTDRDRLEALCREREQKLLADEQQKKQRLLAMQESQMRLDQEDMRKTQELLEHCTQQFADFKLIPTGHPVGVESAPSCESINARPDVIPFVVLHVTHCGDETGGFQGIIPLLASRCRRGRYETFSHKGVKHCATFDEQRDFLLTLLSEMDREGLGHIFKKIRETRRA